MQDEMQILSTLLQKEPFLFIRVLLEKQGKLTLTPIQLILTEYLWLEIAKGNASPSNQYLSQLSGISETEVRIAITELIGKKLLQLVTIKTSEKIIEEYDISPLINTCFAQKITKEKTTNSVKQLVSEIELEFSRNLSPIEIQYINTWLYDEHIAIEVIREALKETILSGVKNFKYMSAVIHNWQTQGKKAYTPYQKVTTTSDSREDSKIANIDWERALHEDE